MTDYNALSIQVYSSGSTQAVDVDGSIANARGIRLETFYPGGLFGEASFLMPRLPDMPLHVKSPYRVVIRNGNHVCYEGRVYRTKYARSGGVQGNLIQCVGEYGYRLVNRGIDKPWCDDRVSRNVWYEVGGASIDKCRVELLNNNITFIPRAEAWTNGGTALIKYKAPVGQTIKRITYSYDLQEAAQNWYLTVYRSTNGTTGTAMTNASGESYNTGTTTVITSSGTGSIDVELATPSRWVFLAFIAGANQTPTSDGTYYGEYSNIKIYTETDAAITMNVIVSDIRAAINAVADVISANDTYIETPASELTLEPYYTDGTKYFADIMAEVTGYGDGAGNYWSFGCLERDKSSDGKTLFYLEQYPATTDYEYQISLRDTNLVDQYSIITDDVGDLANYIIVKYTDVNGFAAEVTPTDSATLTDATSVADYGRRMKILTIGSADSTTATAAGVRYLARHKDPEPQVDAPIRVQEYIRGKSGEPVPAANIRAGNRIKISDFSTSFIAVITRTQYDHDSRTCSISVGRRPDDTNILLARLARDRGIT